MFSKNQFIGLSSFDDGFRAAKSPHFMKKCGRKNSLKSFGLGRFLETPHPIRCCSTDMNTRQLEPGSVNLNLSKMHLEMLKTKQNDITA